MTHGELLAAVQLAVSRGDSRLLRANSGDAWVGKIVFQDRHKIILSPYRVFHGHLTGTPDLLGWAGPYFAAVEIKTGRDTVKPAQQRVIDLVLACGGRAGVARSVDDARLIITGKNTPGD